MDGSEFNQADVDGGALAAPEVLAGEVVASHPATVVDGPISVVRAVRDDLLPPMDERTPSQQQHIDNGKNLLVAGAGLLAAGIVAVAVGGAL